MDFCLLSGRSLVQRAPTKYDVKVKFPRYRPKSALGGSRRLRLLDFLDFRRFKGAKVVTLTHRPHLPPGVFLVLIFRG